MKLIYVKEKNGTEHFFSPLYVKDIKVVKSEYNKDWCIVLNLSASRDSVAESTYTILCESEEDCTNRVAEIKAAMESI